MTERNPIDGLRAAAQRRLVDNTRTLARFFDRRPDSPLTLEQRAGRVWDLSAKTAFAERVMDEEINRSFAESAAAGMGRPHNNDFDALRHARASKRIAEVAGPAFATAAGVGHEVDNFVGSLRKHKRATGDYGGPYSHREKSPTPGQTLDEIRMDLRNNLEGVSAAVRGGEIDPGRLQTRVRETPTGPLYRFPPAGLEGLPRR